MLEACRALARRTGAELRLVPSDPTGLVDLDALADACTPDVRLVSVMTVNNELGTVQPLADVARVVGERSPAAVLHTDAVQAVPWLDAAAVTAPADLVSVSAHKFGGPKGSGALVLRRGADGPAPGSAGGGQERGRRSGTPNVAGAVGTAAALAATVAGRTADGRPGCRPARPAGRRAGGAGPRTGRVGATRGPGGGHPPPAARRGRVRGAGGAARRGGDRRLGRGGVLERGRRAEPRAGVASASTRRRRRPGVRFSLGVTTTDEDVDHALDRVPHVVERLRN